MNASLKRCALVSFLLLGFLTARPTQAQTHITVDASQPVRVVDERVFGLNTAIWDELFTGNKTLPLLQAADTRALRFPGGSLSDTYDWKLNKSYDTTTGNLNTWTWTNDFDDFAPVAVALGAQVFITINYGSGTVQLAADWVKYANVTKGYGFKYWEIGNENYGSWEYDTHPAGTQWDPVTYATEAKAYIAAMKAVDPTIKIGVVISYNAGQPEDYLDAMSPVHNVVNPRTGVTHHGWTPVVLSTLRTLGVTPDFAIYHRYDGAPGQESDAALLQKAQTWRNDAAALRQQLNDYLGPVEGPKVELTVTENNSVYSNPGKQTTSLVNGLYLADSTGQLLQTEFNSLIWWDLRNGRDASENNSPLLYGWRLYGDYGIIGPDDVPYPTYYVTKLLSHFARGGDSVVSASSDNSLLAAYAAKRADGSLTLLVINKSPSATTTGDFIVQGFTPAGGASVYSYGIPQDNAAETGVGSPDLALSTLSGLGSTFQASFAPYSVTVIALDPAPPPAPVPPVGYASGMTEVTLSWASLAASGNGITGYGLQRATDAAFTQNVTTFSTGLFTSYVDATVAADTTYYYRLTAMNSGGTSAPSTGLQVETPASTGSAASHFVNISTRAYASTGNNVTIGGFVISGTSDKQVLLRAVGPTLATLPNGLPPAAVLADPQLELHDSLNGGALIASNGNWGDNGNASDIVAAAARLGATPLGAADTTSAALLITLKPGVYTMVVSGANSTSGIVLAEVYDADPTDQQSPFVNISTRAECGLGNQVAIGGFVIVGGASKRVLLRAIGPTLATLADGPSADEVLADPMLELHDTNHGNAVIALNDDVGDNANAADIVATGARVGATPIAPGDTRSAALLLTLPPGVYSVIASGRNGGSGIVLVEVYDAD